MTARGQKSRHMQQRQRGRTTTARRFDLVAWPRSKRSELHPSVIFASCSYPDAYHLFASPPQGILSIRPLEPLRLHRLSLTTMKLKVAVHRSCLTSGRATGNLTERPRRTRRRRVDRTRSATLAGSSTPSAFATAGLSTPSFPRASAASATGAGCAMTFASISARVAGRMSSALAASVPFSRPMAGARQAGSAAS